MPFNILFYFCLLLTTYNFCVILDLTRDELEELKQMAVTYLGSATTYSPCKSMTRDKSEAYFNNILSMDGIMEPYIKDNNGDQASPINGQIHGLFFAPGPPKKFSYFGPMRLNVPTGLLFNDQTNIYFADFWCHYSVHYVTVVITTMGSKTDQFCKKNCLELNKYNNEFFKLDYLGNVLVAK